MTQPEDTTPGSETDPLDAQFNMPARQGIGQRHIWSWQREADGACSLPCDGDVLITVESLAALTWVGRHLQSGEMEP